MAVQLCNVWNIWLLITEIILSACFMISNHLVEGSSNINTFNEDVTIRPQIEISQGRLHGINMITHHGRKIFGFKGIPYAQPPVGELRFKGPAAADAWNGTFDASSETSLCPQVDGEAIIGNEDCLYVNVYTPRLPTNESSTLLPVILYTVGGTFKTGHNRHTRWGPYYLLDKDVLLVVPSYRMGVLGYLSTGDDASPGNYGLKDLVQALKWNQENIKYFGGDPNRVTLMGGSSGAISVHLLALSKSTDGEHRVRIRGLFHKYITQSGTALVMDAYQPTQKLRKYAVQLGKHLGCPTDTSMKLLSCLRDVNTSRLIDTESLFKEWMQYPVVVWGPSIEPDIEGAFLTETPSNLFAAGKIPDMPWLSSVTRNEGILYSAVFFEKLDLFEKFLANIDTALPHILQYDSLVNDVTAFTNALKSYYLNDLTANRTLLLSNFTQLAGDALFAYPAHCAIRQQLRVHQKNTSYFCSFEYRGTLSYSYWFSGGSDKNYGVSHGDEILYLFKNLNDLFGPTDLVPSEADLRMMDTLVQLWTSFVINGAPTTGPETFVTWEPYSTRDNYLRIGSDSDTSLEMRNNFFENRMQFWKDLYTATSWKEPFYSHC